MNTLFANWEQGWPAAGWTMLHFLWLGTAVALVGSLLRRACRRAPATVRYAISLATFAALALLPIAITVWLSTSSDYTKQVAHTTPTSVSVRPQADLPPTPAPLTSPPEPHDSQPATPLPTTRAPQLAPPNHFIAYLPWLWLLGSPLTFALLTTGLIGAERLRRRSQSVQSASILKMHELLCTSLHVGRRVTIAVCDSLSQPVLVGIVRPLILLPPAALTGWSPEQLEMVLLHELSHVRRWDNLVNFMQRVVESLLFFHPAVWMVSRQVRHDREECCDAVVVAHTAKPQAYAELLVELAAAPAPLVGLAMARHPLSGRIRRILKLEDEPMLVSRNTLGLVGMALVASLVVMLWQPVETSVAEEAAVVTTEKENITVEDAEIAEDSASRVVKVYPPRWDPGKASPFLSLEDQRAADLIYKRLGLELEPLTEGELVFVKQLGYEGGLRATGPSGPGQPLRAYEDAIPPGDLLLGLHVWPTNTLQDVRAILSRKEIADLSPLKFYAVHQGSSGGGNNDPEKVFSGRIEVHFDAIKPKASVGKGESLYDGKTFDEWRQMWKTELKTEKRTECINALAAFARVGHAKEAAETILDVAGEYDFQEIGESPEGYLEQRVLDVLSAKISMSLWLPSLLERYDADGNKWVSLANGLVRSLETIDAPSRQQLLELANSDHDLSLTATWSLLRMDRDLKHPETVEIARRALQGKHPDIHTLSLIGYRHLDRVPEQFDLLFHKDLNVRKWARTTISRRGDHQLLVDKLFAVLNDPAQSKKHVYVIRAFSVMYGFEEQKRVEAALLKIAREGDKQLLGPALLAYKWLTRGDSGQIIKRLQKSALSEDRQQLLSNTDAIEQLIDQELRFMTSRPE